MTLDGWAGGLNHMFLLFTSTGEGSCFTSASTTCAYVISPPGYCAYHSAFLNGVGVPVIYGNEPYGDLSVCRLPSEPSPNSDALADDAATIASHEISEAITDPFGSAWFEDSFGFEIGDPCAYDYGTLTWDSSQANEMWNGDFYLLQREYDNHAGGCVQVSP